jgi:hypothetical protein
VARAWARVLAVAEGSVGGEDGGACEGGREGVREGGRGSERQCRVGR